MPFLAGEIFLLKVSLQSSVMPTLESGISVPRLLIFRKKSTHDILIPVPPFIKIQDRLQQKLEK